MRDRLLNRVNARYGLLEVPPLLQGHIFEGVKMSDNCCHRRQEIYAALVEIAYALNGIDREDLTQAEKQICNVLVRIGVMDKLNKSER